MPSVKDRIYGEANFRVLALLKSKPASTDLRDLSHLLSMSYLFKRKLVAERNLFGDVGWLGACSIPSAFVNNYRNYGTMPA